MSNIKEHFVIGSQRHYSSTKRDTKFSFVIRLFQKSEPLFQTFRNLSFAVLKLQLHRTRQWVSLKNNKIQCVTHTKNVTSPPSDGRWQIQPPKRRRKQQMFFGGSLSTIRVLFRKLFTVIVRRPLYFYWQIVRSHKKSTDFYYVFTNSMFAKFLISEKTTTSCFYENL